MVSVMPGPCAATVPARMPSCCSFSSRLLAGLLGLVGAVLQLGALVLQTLLLVLETLGAVVELVEDAHQVLLAGAAQRAVVAVGADLDGQAEAEARTAAGRR